LMVAIGNGGTCRAGEVTGEKRHLQEGARVARHVVNFEARELEVDDPGARGGGRDVQVLERRDAVGMQEQLARARARGPVHRFGRRELAAQRLTRGGEPRNVGRREVREHEFAQLREGKLVHRHSARPVPGGSARARSLAQSCSARDTRIPPGTTNVAGARPTTGVGKPANAALRSVYRTEHGLERSLVKPASTHSAQTTRGASQRPRSTALEDSTARGTGSAARAQLDAVRGEKRGAHRMELR
jgi:hypothetical protein